MMQDPFDAPADEADTGSLPDFQTLLRNGGLVVETSPDSGTMLYCQNGPKLTAHLKTAIEYNKEIQSKFLAGLAECFEENDAEDLNDEIESEKMTMLHASLVPLLAKPDIQEDGTEQPQICTRIRESLMQLFLRLDCIQDKVIQFILEKFSTVSLTQVAMGDGTLKNNIARLLLHQLRWLDFVVNPESLTTKLLECVETVCGFDAGDDNKAFATLQREIISIIPELTAEKQYPAAVGKLQTLLQIKPDLTVAIIEALSNVTIPTTQLNSITTSVLNVLRSSPLGDIPVAIKFLLESVQNHTGISSGLDVEEVSETMDGSTDAGSVATTSTDSAALNIIHEMRERLLTIPSTSHNMTDPDPTMTESQQDQVMYNEASSAAASKALILRVLVNGFLIRDNMAKAFLKSVSMAKATIVSPAGFRIDGETSTQVGAPRNQALPPARPIGEIDWWVLVSLYGSPRYRKLVFALIQQHTTETNLLDRKFIQRAISGHGSALEGIFAGLLSLASSLLRYGKDASTSLIRRLGVVLYVNVFREFSDLYLRQQVVHALIMHCGGGSDAELEVNAALGCFMAIANSPQDLISLHPFAEFVKHLTDQFDQFSNDQVRMIIYVITRLILSKINANRSTSSADNGGGTQNSGASGVTYQTINTANAMEDESAPSADRTWFHNLMRKYLASPDMNRRVIGIISTTQYMAALAPPAALSIAGHSSSLRAMKYALKTTKVIFEHASQAAQSSSQAKAFLLDELAYLVERDLLHADIVSLINDRVCEELTNKFVRDLYVDEMIGESSTRNSPVNALAMESIEGRYLAPLPLCFGASIQSELWMNLDEDLAEIGINILYLLSQGENKPKVRDMLLSLGPTVRLLMASGTVDQYDATLVAPILMPQLELITNLTLFESQPRNIRESICLAIFHATNWVRELLNGFAPSDKPDVRARVVQRLGNLVELEKYLEKCTRATPSFPYVLENLGLLTLSKVSKGPRKAKASSSTSSAKQRSSSVGIDVEDGPTEAAAAGTAATDDETNSNNVLSDAENDASAPNRKSKGKGKKRKASQSVNPDKAVQLVRGALRELRPSVCNTLRFKPVLQKLVNDMAETVQDSKEEIHMTATQLSVILRVLDTKVKVNAGPKKKASPFAKMAGGASENSNRFQQSRIETGTFGPELEVCDSAPMHSSMSVSQVLQPESQVEDTSTTDSAELGWLRYCSTYLLAHVRSKVDDLVVGISMSTSQRSTCSNDPDDDELQDAVECIRLLCSILSSYVTSPMLQGTQNGRLSISDALSKFRKHATVSHSQGSEDENTIEKKWEMQLGENCAHAFEYVLSLTQCTFLTDLSAICSVLELLNEIQQVHAKVVAPRLSRDDRKALGKIGLSLSAIQNPEITPSSGITLSQWFGLRMSQRTEDMLNTDWALKHHSGNCYTRENLTVLINSYLLSHETLAPSSRFVAIEELSGQLQTLYSNKFKGGKFPCVNKTTFDHIYKVVLSAIVKTTTRLELKKYYRSRGRIITWARNLTPARVEAALDNLNDAMKNLERMVLITKVCSKRVILSAVLQQGNAFVALFKSVVMPFLHVSFGQHKDTVLQILGTFQKTTRQLQSVCAYGKNKKDTQMMKATPAMKRALETVIFQVKQLCSHNDCEDIFDSGVLKSRNIDGTRHVESEHSSSSSDEEDAE